MNGRLKVVGAAVRQRGELVLLGFGRGTEALINIVQVRLYSQFLPVVEVGRLAMILAIAGFFMQMFLATAGTFVQRYSVEWRAEHRLRREVMNFTYYLLMALPLTAILLLAGHQFLSSIAQFSLPVLVLLICANVFFQGQQQNVTAVLNMLGYRRWFVLMSNLAILAAVSGAFLFSRLFGSTALIWQSGFVAGLALLVPFILARVWHNRPTSPAVEVLHPAPSMFSAGAISFMLPLLVSAMCFWIQNFGYRLALGEGAGPTIVGIFTVGFTLGTLPLTLIIKIATDYLLPGFYQSCAHRPEVERIRAWEGYARLFISMGLLSAPLVAAAAIFFCRFLVGPNFWQYAWLAVFGAAFQFLFLVYGVYLVLAQALHKNETVIFGNVASSVAIIVGTLLLAHSYPLAGTGLSLLAGAVLLLGMTAWSLHRRYCIFLPWPAFGFAALLGAIGWAGTTFVASLMPSPSLLISAAVLGPIGLYFLASTGLFLRFYGKAI